MVAVTAALPDALVAPAAAVLAVTQVQVDAVPQGHLTTPDVAVRGEAAVVALNTVAVLLKVALAVAALDFLDKVQTAVAILAQAAVAVLEAHKAVQVLDMLFVVFQHCLLEMVAHTAAVLVDITEQAVLVLAVRSVLSGPVTHVHSLLLAQVIFN
jgi:hypothetical protein